MTNPTHSGLSTVETDAWELNALTEALGDLTVTVSESLSVGRGSDNDVVLGSKQVSRNHAVLSILGGELYVKDLDSSNGTFINDERIESNKSSLLTVDDKIGFASFSFQVNKSVSDTGIEPVKADDATAIINTDTENTVASESVVKERTVQEPVIEEPAVQEPVIEKSEVKEPIIEAPIEAPAAEEPVVKKTDIEEMLPTKEDTTSTPSHTATATKTDTPAEAMKQEPVVATERAPTTDVDHDPLVEQPTVHKEQAVHAEPIVQPEHDKTTKTELQEEADPEVLRAKQAATAQFSGTANLGQERDLGTEGNNAMNQAVDNPAATGQVEKKPSGSWFIWVFVALIIIGIALWLFNMGGTGAGA